MKYFNIILFSVIAFSFASANDDIKLKYYDIHSLHGVSKTSCDLCACYLGIDPHFNNNSFGIRFSQFAYHLDGHIEPASDHPGHGTGESDEKYNNFELYGKYYVNPELRLMLNIPFSSNDINGKSIKGLGDATILAQYQLYNTEVDGDTKFRNRLFVTGGLKLPTGEYNKILEIGAVNPHIQSGTGSFDVLTGVTYLAKYKGLGLSTDVIYTFNSTNKNDFKFGNRFNLTSALFYQIQKGYFWTFLPHAGVYFETAGKDTQNGNAITTGNTNALFATGGFDVYYKSFSINFNYQHPVSQTIETGEPENVRRFYIGAGYSF